MKIKVIYATMAEVDADCKLWAKEIQKSFVPDIIVFLAKSGFLYAKPFAEYFKVPMVDLSAGRTGNSWKDRIKKYMPFIPKGLISAIVSSPMKYYFHGKKKSRNLQRTDRYKKAEINKYNRILLVDDTADTGWSLIEALRILRNDAPKASIKTACYSVSSVSEEKIRTSFYRYKDRIVISGASRYSEEYDIFMNSFNMWKGKSEMAVQ